MSVPIEKKFLRAAKNNNLVLVRDCIAEGVSVDTKDSVSITIIFVTLAANVYLFY